MNKVLFLDRDGVINVDHGYVHKPNDFEFMDGIFDVCRHALKLNYLIIIITNQSGIGRQYYTEAQFNELTDWMVDQFNLRNIEISDVFFCPHHPSKAIGEYKQTCHCRKPKPGLILQAEQKYTVDLSQSIFIGDKGTDMQAAEAAGIKTKIFFQEETVITEHQLELQTDNNSRYIITALQDAIPLIR